MYGIRGKTSYFCRDYIDYTNFLKQMISNWFYYCFTLLTATFIFSSCLNSDTNEIDYTVSRDAQLTSLTLSSSEDSSKVLSKIKFSIDQVSSAPLIFNKDSLPYLFDVSTVSLKVTTNGASGIKLYLIIPDKPDSTYIWNETDSVMIKKLKNIEIFAQDGKTSKTYTFKLNTHKEDPDTIFWQNVATNYIAQPSDQITVSNRNKFYTFYKSGTSIKLSTSPIEEVLKWTINSIIGLPQNVVMKSIQNNTFEDNITRWNAIDADNKVYESTNGIDWTLRTTAYPVKAILGRLPSFTKDAILTIIQDGASYKFAKTKDFSTFEILNNLPLGFPVKDFTSTTINDPDNYTAKYLVVTGGTNLDNRSNKSVWLLQEGENRIAYTSQAQTFNVSGSTLFKYDKKMYLLTSENNKNVFYTSTNYGVFWLKASNKQQLPTAFKNRNNQSIQVDDKNIVWIFGGESNSLNQLVEVWKGRINKLFMK